MKIKLILFSALLLTFLIPVNSLYAKMEPDDISQKKTEIKQKVEDKKASIEAKLTESKKEIIGKFWTRMKKVMLSSIERLEKIATKIESRLTILVKEDPTSDLSTAKKDVADARALLTKTRVDIAAMDTQMSTILNSEDPKAAFKSAQVKIKSIRDQIKKAHSLLVHSIGEVRGLRSGGEDVKVSITLTPTLSPSPTLTPGPTLTLTPTP